MIKVGTFTKSVAAAPVSQAVINVGFPPKALILWSSAQTALGSWTPHIITSLGASDGITSRSVCAALKDNVSASNTYRLFSDSALCFVSEDGALLAEADAALEVDGFSLTWTTNNAAAYYLHYLALGGDDLTDANLVPWTLTTAVGNQSVAGVGFEPDLVIHLSAFVATTELDTIQIDAAQLGLGAMDDGGRQFAVASGGYYNGAFGNLCTGVNRSDATLSRPSMGLVPSEDSTIAYVSMDAGGFTVSKTVVPPADYLMASLCLRGGAFYVGTFEEIDAPGNQAIAGLPFSPEGVFFFDAREIDAANRYKFQHGFGAIDGTSQCATAVFAETTAKPTAADGADWAGRCIYSGAEATATTDDAEFVSLDANGFTINWLTQTYDDHDYGFIAFDTGGIAPPTAVKRFGGAMTTPFTSKKWALWVQPAGPNTPNYYLGCHTLDDVEEPGGGIKDLIRCFKADGSGWEIRGSTRNPPEPITTTVTGLIENTANWLERIVEGANCPFPLYVNGKLCPPYDVFGGADRWYTLESAEIGTASLMGLAHREEDNISEQSFEITAWPPMIRGRGITSDRVTVTATENWNDIASCSTPRCGGVCGAAVDACDTLVAVADADPASADVWFSFDNGATWTAGTTDPYSGLVTDLKAVICFPIDSDTTRVLVVREAFAGSPAAVYYSDDWGANWTEVLLTTPNGYGAMYGGALFALDMYHIWVVVTDGAASEVHFSDDGGETWTEQTVPAGVFYALWFSDVNTGMMVGTTDDVIITTDGGTTWTAATATGGGDTNLTVTESAGGDYWWIGTNAGEIWYSSDHGVTWTQRAFPGDGAGSVYSIDFISPTVGFMAHSPTNATAILYRTRDGGLTWEAESGTIPGEIYSVKACSVNQAFAVGEIATTALVYKMHD